MVNGVPIEAQAGRHTLFFKPDGPGFARLTVMDARGLSDSVMVRDSAVNARPCAAIEALPPARLFLYCRAGFPVSPNSARPIMTVTTSASRPPKLALKKKIKFAGLGLGAVVVAYFLPELTLFYALCRTSTTLRATAR